MAQYKYSVGDRVRVVWQGFMDADATVIKVHASNAVDVLYDKSGTVGVSLTAAEHILELMDVEDGKPKEEKPVIVKVKVSI